MTMETETFHGQEFPCPGDWTLGAVEFDGVTWINGERSAALWKDLDDDGRVSRHTFKIDGKRVAVFGRDIDKDGILDVVGQYLEKYADEEPASDVKAAWFGMEGPRDPSDPGDNSQLTQFDRGESSGD